MEKFAKVFESHGRQFLVMKNQNDEGDPKLSIITRIDGAELDLGFIFHDDDGEERMDAAFDAFSVENVKPMAEKLQGVNTPLEAIKALQA